MADLKISQLTAKGTAIASTDLLEISESNGAGGYVTKSVTGANIIGSKQDTLVSGTNIKTINSTTLLGSGNLAVQPTLVSSTNIKTINSNTLLGSGDLSVQPTLVSGTNIKTINSNSILGSGDLVITGGVSSVTATTPVVATGTTTPVISLASNYGDTQNPYASKTANNILAAPNGSSGVPTFRAIVGADIPTLNQNTTGTANNVTGIVAVANGGTGTATPSLVAGTNITITGTFPNQTIAASGAAGAVTQIVAGTNVTISPAGGTGVVTINASSGGGGGGGGVHQLTKPISNQLYNARLTIGNNFSTGSSIANNISLYPFIPANSITIKDIKTSVDTPAVVGGLLRILVYSDLNGVPSSKLLESADLDASTTGDKTYTTSFTFTAGTTYWLGIFTNLATIKIPIFLDAQITVLEASSIYGSTQKSRSITATYPTAPATLGATSLSTSSPFSINFTAL